MTATMPAIEALYPLSPTQQGLLFHSLYGPDSGVYVVQLGFTVQGDLDLEAFRRAWHWLVQRHAVLRTAFTWESLEEPLQVVGLTAAPSISVHDWQGKSSQAWQRDLADWLVRDRRQGFDLSAAPLMRVAILQLAADTYRIVWTYHHLLLDGWSVPLVLRELLIGYQAFAEGQSPTLAAPHPYRHYIAWLQRQNADAAMQFWQQRLQGLSAPTPLGIDQTRRTTAANPNYALQQQSLTPELTAQLRTFAQTHRLTLNTLVQGAWAWVLGRYSGEPEVLFGSTCAGRPPTLPGAETMVGLFINTLPMRVNLSPDQPVGAWLRQLQTQQLDQQPYEYTPLVKIHGSSDIPRSLPLFESVVVFENYPVEPALQRQVQDLAIADVTTAEQTNYPLTLFAVAQSTLDLKVQYDSERFTTAAIARLLGHLETVLAGLIAHIDDPIGKLPLLTPAEQQQCQSWNQTTQTIPDRCVHELVADQATATPDATAVIFADTTLSYQALNQRAHQLANYLVKKGVQPGDGQRPALEGQRVAVCLERSAELVITLLAILKAGATYIPLDPTYPAERLRFILEDAQVSLLIVANAGMVGNARQGNEFQADSATSVTHPTVPILDLIEEAAAIAHSPPPSYGRTAVRPAPTHHAKLINTTRATRTPKGVPNQQQTLTNQQTTK
ncbi:MAG: condensation domain-containing protein, partial [Cyanobacteria bacterium P01_C01_bin.147]